MLVYHKDFHYYLHMFENPGSCSQVISFGFKLSLKKKIPVSTLEVQRKA